jgi:di/tricarboxylate transporter
MVVTRCIAGSEARRSINWQVLLVIGAALGMGAAVEETGLASMAGNTLAALGSETSLFVVLLVLFLVASIGSQFVTAYAAAALLLPVAMGLAASLGADPTIFTFVLMIGVGCSFITPIGYQTNLMVYGPGGYRFLDFMRLGAPLTIVLAVLCAWLAPVIYG